MHPLRHILAAEALLAGFLERRRRELSLLDSVRKNLPPALASQTRVADASAPELTLSAASGAVAALLRHRAPELLDTLAREGWKFTGIRVRVQARHYFADRSKVHAKQIDGESAAALRSGAERIRDPRLVAALRRLADGESTASDQQQALQSVEDQRSEEQK
jgi:hypothetical protein